MSAIELHAGTNYNYQWDADTLVWTKQVASVAGPGGGGDASAANQTTEIARLTSILAELGLKADLTETQPVSLASVPSHQVTNAGTFAVQATTTAAKPASATVSPVTGTGASITLAASNASRATLTLENASGVVAYIKLGGTASSSSRTVKMVDGAFYELPQPIYTGAVVGLWASGDIMVTET